MSEFRFQCPACEKANVIRKSNVGHIVRCTHCRTRIAWDDETPVIGPEDDPIPPRKTNWSKISGALLAFLVSVPTLVTGSRDLYWGANSRSWTPISGEIIAANTQAGPDVVSSRGTGVQVDDTTAASIRYRYEVDGQTYDGSTVRFGQVYSSSMLIGTARDTLERNPIGPGTIYVDPDNPARSVLEPGLTAAAFLKPGVSLMFSCVGVWLLFTGFVSPRRG